MVEGLNGEARERALAEAIAAANGLVNAKRCAATRSSFASSGG